MAGWLIRSFVRSFVRSRNRTMQFYISPTKTTVTHNIMCMLINVLLVPYVYLSEIKFYYIVVVVVVVVVVVINMLLLRQTPILTAVARPTA